MNSQQLELAEKREGEEILADRIELQQHFLKDSVTMLAYRDAFRNTQHLFKGKTVLDVGCGMGLLSLFAAKAGAAKVIAIEESVLADSAKQIMLDNRWNGVVQIIKDSIVKVRLPAGIEKVDIIISNWMGQCLYSNSLYHHVLFARDIWLKRNGLVFPKLANLYIAGITDNGHRDKCMDLWKNVQGFNLSCVGKKVTKNAVIDCVTIHQILTNSCVVNTVDMRIMRNKPLQFRSGFKLKVQHSGDINAFVIYFDVSFPVSETRPTVTFSTSPRSPVTHWKQTVLYLDKPISALENECVNGFFGIMPSAQGGNATDFELSVAFNGSVCKLYKHQKIYSFS
ncbi:protein arginine N-methyltransferase 1-like [Scaptodrosophila lebanonensis]|uniref:Protein arginine N-methyltransferase 1-like n=1 Tax=Drosophila lebanonensis TaxID=7225 RepID=A0A6J2THW9_DROLE|nr:protein arginine N-methyltransferase 1-like [Scaptodrosophila lebanonensis]